MKSYKFKLRPSKKIQASFESWLDICREIYNAGLQERRDAWKFNRISVNYYSQQNQLPAIKKVREDVAEVNAQVLQDALRRVAKAFNNFFRRVKNNEKAGFPRFKGKNFFNSFTFPQRKGTFRLKNDKLYLSKIGSCRMRLSREIIGIIKTCTIKRETDGWYVIFACESEKQPFAKSGKSIGVDVGITRFATLSNGEQINNPEFLRKSERRLKTAQRNVSRKKTNGGNRKKAVQLLRRQHLKIKRQRNDFLHKTANYLVKRFDNIAIEDLKIKNMVKNHCLAKSISDACWGTFFGLLIYKAENADKKVWKVNAANTSQNCSQCGVKVPKSLSVRVHKCTKCGLELDRDINAAINIEGRADLLPMSSVTMAKDAGIFNYMQKAMIGECQN